MAEIELRSGRVAVVWVPVGADEIGEFRSTGERAAALHALAGLHPRVHINLDAILRVGTLLRVRSGTYRASCGAHDGAQGRYAPAAGQPADGDWSCRWIRCTRRAP